MSLDHRCVSGTQYYTAAAGRFYWGVPVAELNCEKVSNQIHWNNLNTLLRSSEFDAWLSNLADQKAKARILARVVSGSFGNFGDAEPVGGGVSEMRIHVGQGYRIYYTRTGPDAYVLLAGGVKASQAKDIRKAKQMARELKRVKP